MDNSIYNYSLIIPHYNTPDLLRRLLRTVTKRDDLQVIAVDDCSTKNLNKLDSVKKGIDINEGISVPQNV